MDGHSEKRPDGKVFQWDPLSKARPAMGIGSFRPTAQAIGRSRSAHPPRGASTDDSIGSDGLWSQDENRHYRRRPYRRHDRRALGQGRPSGILLVTSSGGIERARRAPWPSCTGRLRRSCDCVWRRRIHRRALRRPAADRGPAILATWRTMPARCAVRCPIPISVVEWSSSSKRFDR
jgi:hypothetical protein